MISIDDAIQIQSLLINRFGGSDGLRDRKLLESALMRPYQTFDSKELYTTPSEKAAAILESILINHPFVDGNKRFVYVVMPLTLMAYGCDILAKENDKYYFIIKIASGELKFQNILEWINERIIEIA